MTNQIIIGCDECGNGSLIGSVLVCGVSAPSDWSLPDLNDSKKLSAKKRDLLFPQLMEQAASNVINYHLAQRDHIFIDKFGIIPTLNDAFTEVFHALHQPNSLIIVDGFFNFDNLGVDDYHKIAEPKADGKYPTVMAASIIAKVSRDRQMKELDELYPNYNWAKNNGYGTVDHLAAIQKYGPTPLHRTSYNPVKAMLANNIFPDPKQTSFNF